MYHTTQGGSSLQIMISTPAGRTIVTEIALGRCHTAFGTKELFFPSIFCKGRNGILRALRVSGDLRLKANLKWSEVRDGISGAGFFTSMRVNSYRLLNFCKVWANNILLPARFLWPATSIDSSRAANVFHCWAEAHLEAEYRRGADSVCGAQGRQVMTGDLCKLLSNFHNPRLRMNFPKVLPTTGNNCYSQSAAQILTLHLEVQRSCKQSTYNHRSGQHSSVVAAKTKPFVHTGMKQQPLQPSKSCN